MSAGDWVKFPTDRKLADDGEKTGWAWIFSSFPRGKKTSLNPARVRMIKNPGKGFRSLRNEGEITRWMNRRIRDAPKSTKEKSRNRSLNSVMLAVRDGELRLTVATIWFPSFLSGKMIVWISPWRPGSPTYSSLCLENILSRPETSSRKS